MQKIVVDTNVLVSSLISKSYPALIIDELVFGRKVTSIITDEIWLEYVAVLGREKFARFTNLKRNAEIVLLRLDEISEQVIATERVAVIADADDNRFLEAAKAGSADYIITGNTNDFLISSFGETSIVTPKVYWEQHRPL